MEEDSLIYKLYKTKLVSRLTYSQYYFLRKDLKGYKSALDIGSGVSSPLRYCKIPYTVGVDIFEPVLLESKTHHTHTSYIRGDVAKLALKPNSFDAVVVCEALEHLTK